MTTKHGYPILEMKHNQFTGNAVIIAKRPENFQPFVVWRYNMRNGQTYSGGYHQTIEEARTDYEKRSP